MWEGSNETLNMWHSTWFKLPNLPANTVHTLKLATFVFMSVFVYKSEAGRSGQHASEFNFPQRTSWLGKLPQLPVTH